MHACNGQEYDGIMETEILEIFLVFCSYSCSAGVDHCGGNNWDGTGM